MKKSEAVSYIAHAILGYEGKVVTGDLRQKLASDLLSIAEELGLAPPHQDVLITRDWGTFYTDGEREWDEE